jgi:phage baseplate assembly protein W
MSSFSWTLPASSQQTGSAEEQSAILLGKDILFDGDFRVSATGDYILLEGKEALRQAIYRRLLTRPGEYRARPEYGVGVLDFVKRRRVQSTLDELRQRVVDQLSLDSRISEVVDVVGENIDDGFKLLIIVRVAGETLQFAPFNFTERQVVGGIDRPGIRIGG